MYGRVFLFTIFSLCLSASAFGQTIVSTMTHGGIQRGYIIYVPSGYTGAESVPLLFNFHGYTSNATEQYFYSNFAPIADSANFIMVLPEGTNDATGNTHFNVGWGGSSVDDVSFTNALIDTLVSGYNIDESRVYSTGMSNGGFMSFLLACELSDRIAAIGSVTGSMTFGSMPTCNATHQTPVLQIHGTSDATVAYNGSAFSEPVPSVIDFWTNFNNTVDSDTVDMPNISTTDGSTVERMTYSGGDNCSEVIHYKVTGGSHSWPWAPLDIGGTNYDIAASQIVWNFVSQYDINGKIDCPTAGIEESISHPVLNVYPNPTSAKFSIIGLNTRVQFELHSVLGERVLSGSADAQNNSIDVSTLKKGVYFLKTGGEVLEVIVD